MNDRYRYTPGPASGARVEKAPDKWTLILVRDLCHPPEKIWQALIDPEHLREWAPFDADGKLDSAGKTVRLTWVGTARVTETKVTRADAPRVLEYGEIRWELEPVSNGTRLTLWHSIDRHFVAWGAASWHICLDVLDRLISGIPIGRMIGAGAMQHESWQRLSTEYAKQFGVEMLGPKSSSPKR